MLNTYYGVPKDATWKGFMERFPILFQDRTKPMSETCICFGIECPIGWFHIIEQLCTILEFYNIEFTKNHRIAIVADQVKEKFGTLRFYYTVREVSEDGLTLDWHDDELSGAEENKARIAKDYLEMLADNIIREAEHMTENTCANCGVPLDDENRVVTDGWITYLCKECHENPKRFDDEDDVDEEPDPNAPKQKSIDIETGKELS